MLEALVDIGLRKEDFDLHSILPGRWKSENVKNGYIEDNLESLLVVTKSLGL